MLPLTRFAFILLSAGALAVAQAPSFDYDHSKPFDVRRAGGEYRDGVSVEDISFANDGESRTEAYLIHAQGKGKSPGALFVHWYESESPYSNRKQFLQEATELARHGLTSLLVSTPWSVRDWYPKRDVTRDYENSVQEVKDLRRALDFLATQPDVDRRRIVLVGHDFGAMYGLLAASGDKRVSAVALQAFTSSFSDWFLYNQKQLSPAGRQAVIDRLAPLDPIRYLPGLKNTPVLLQFSNNDFYVPREKAEALYAAVAGPKQILWYDAGHGLNDQASADRQRWLREKLRLR